MVNMQPSNAFAALILIGWVVVRCRVQPIRSQGYHFSAGFWQNLFCERLSLSFHKLKTKLIFIYAVFLTFFRRIRFLKIDFFVFKQNIMLFGSYLDK